MGRKKRFRTYGYGFGMQRAGWEPHSFPLEFQAEVWRERFQALFFLGIALRKPDFLRDAPMDADLPHASTGRCLAQVEVLNVGSQGF